MKTPTSQQIFNKVATHLLTQKKKSLKKKSLKKTRGADDDACLYRGPGGLKCAIGCLIPDSKYDECMENKIVKDILLNYPELRPYLGANESLLEDLQAIHDTDEVKEWFNQLKKTAKDHGLKTSVLKKFKS